jgi:putative redox protein
VSSERIPRHDSGEGEVTVRGDANGFAQEIAVGRHRLASDEPVASGGTNTGPTPYDLLLAALGSCTSITVAMYARRKRWPLESVTVRLGHSRVHATDCAECETKDGHIDRIDVAIAEKCPVHRTLKAEVMIRTRIA